MSNFRRGKKHRGRIGTRGDARAAADAGGGVKRSFGGILWNEDGIGIRRAASGCGDEAARLNDSIERRPIDSQIAEDGECARTPRFERYRIAVLEETHGKLADRGAAPASVRYSVDQKTTRATNPLAAIVLEGNRRFALALKIFIKEI